MKLIKELYTTKEYNDGAVFTSMNYPNFEDIVPENYFFQGPDKIFNIEKKIIYEDGNEYVLPISDNIEVLPDQTGFIVIYGEEPFKYSEYKSYPWFFEHPNNAAIYNADGSLRCQLENPLEHGYIFMFAQSSMKYPDLPSVILDSDQFQHDGSLYNLWAIDINTGKLLKTGQKIRL